MWIFIRINVGSGSNFITWIPTLSFLQKIVFTKLKKIINFVPVLRSRAIFPRLRLGGSRYFFSAPAPTLGKKFRLWLHPKRLGSDRLRLQKTDFYTKLLKNLNFYKQKLPITSICPKNEKKTFKNRFNPVSKNLANFILNCR